MNSYILKTTALFFFISFVACKSDKKENEDLKIENDVVHKQSESEKHLQNILRAHNATKFKEENQVKFNLEISMTDEIFFNGFVTLKTDGSKARFLDSNTDRIVHRNNLNSELDKKLYHLATLYGMGFWLNEDKFEKQTSDQDNFNHAVFETSVNSSTFNISTHPLTDILQNVTYKTNISEPPFNEATVHYDKYITVNRVPVALNWYFVDQTDTIATAKVSRISYPETF